MRRILLTLALLFPAVLPAQARTVIIVRHAEKVDASRDPQLSARGMERASALAAALADAHVDAVITTQFVRTKETARPTAEARRLTPVIVAAGPDAAAHVRAVADAVRARPAGETVLVVGHSNTVGPIVGALGGSNVGDLCDAQYGNFFVLVVPDTGVTRTMRVAFGAADPDDPSCRGMR